MSVRSVRSVRPMPGAMEATMDSPYMPEKPEGARHG